MSQEEKVPPEMLENLDLLMDLDLFESEEDWEAFEAMEKSEAKNE